MPHWNVNCLGGLPLKDQVVLYFEEGVKQGLHSFLLLLGILQGTHSKPEFVVGMPAGVQDDYV
jgi:hypothetical protein